MIAKRVDNLMADTEHGVERIHCPLGDQGDGCQAQPPHLPFGNREEINPVEPDLARFDPARRLDQTQEGECDGGLSRAGFPNQTKRSPRRRSKLTPSTARTAPRGV